MTLVTGGASGLGLGTVARFVKKGASVVICDLPTSDGKQVAESLGSNVQFIPADIRSRMEIKNLVDNIEKQYGQLNVVVNCAGLANAFILYNFKKQRACRLDHFQDILKVIFCSSHKCQCQSVRSGLILSVFHIQTNVIGTYNVICETTKLIEKNQPDKNGLRGVIVNTAGTEAFIGQSGQAAISSASNAIICMTKPLAAQRKEQGIRVVTISPGLIRTPLTNIFPPDVEQALETTCFIDPNRMGEPDEFAHMVQTVVMSSHINGTNINITGGMHIIMT